MKWVLAACLLFVLVSCEIQVYLVPHTHDDVGWEQTIDGYYETEVQYILNSVLESLMANPARKFIYVEQAYFWRWWTSNATTDEQRANMIKVYQNGQLEFVIGGWVMQDEACTTYGAVIDQMTLGHQFLHRTFGAVPTKGWQIDPFGASSVTPTLNKLSGFNAHLIDRVSNKGLIAEKKQLQFTWVGSPSLGNSSAIFSEIMNGATNAYCDWDWLLGVTGPNVTDPADQFYAQVEAYAENILSNVLLVDVGCDFEYQNATSDFEALDLLMEYFKQHETEKGIYVRYATLSEYYDALFTTMANTSYPSLYYEDFFPLDQGDYWTGYYTSRTQLKGTTRKGEAVAHAVESAFAISLMANSAINNQTAIESFANITTLRMANADAQHHDGVTGTSYEFVVQMYEENLINGMDKSLNTLSNFLGSFVTQGEEANLLSPSLDAIIDLQPGEIIPVTFYNSLGWQREDIISLPTKLQSVSVIDPTGGNIVSQVNRNYLSDANATYNLYFQISVAPLGYHTYFVIGGSGIEEDNSVEVVPDADIVLSSPVYTVTISGQTGRISQINNIASGIQLAVDQNILYYRSAASGAYVFSPAGPAQPVNDSAPSSIFQSGPLVDEVYQNFGNYSQQVVRLYKDALNTSTLVNDYLEISFALGPLPSFTEVVTSFSTSVQSGATIFTDDNGFEFLQRTANASGPIQGNYYPTIYASYIEDENTRFTILSERSHGVSTQQPGEIELMVHRNPDMGDNFGPSLTDITTVYPSVRVIVDNPKQSTFYARTHPYLFNFPAVPFTSAPISDISNWKYLPTGQFLENPLPFNLHFLSLYSLDESRTRAIIRLTHLYAVGEFGFDNPVTVGIYELFTPHVISSLVETTLTGNQVIANPAPQYITITPKQIRTFIVEW